jgi:hypothetical protein
MKKSYLKSPYFLQMVKFNDYVRVHNSEPCYDYRSNKDVFFGPACGMKPIKIASQNNFKKMIFFDLSQTQLKFYEYFCRFFDGASNLEGLVVSFKKRYKNSIFKIDVENLNVSYYEKKRRLFVENNFSSRKEYFDALKKFQNIQKEFIHLDLIKNYKKLKSESNNIYFWVSNIFDFEIYKKTTDIDLETRLKKLIDYNKDKNIVYDIQYKNLRGVYTGSEINNILSEHAATR